MDPREHFYDDDPDRGPADVRTRLPGVEYFFLGNGLITAALQHGRGGEGTTLGLLVLPPDRLGPKREALTMDPVSGLEDTCARLETGTGCFRPRAGECRAEWGGLDGLPAARALWRGGPVGVEEFFYCPDRSTPRLLRRFLLRNEGRVALEMALRAAAGLPPAALRAGPGETVTALLVYRVEPTAPGGVEVAWTEGLEELGEGLHYWRGLAGYRCSPGWLTGLFRAARRQLPVVVDRRGRMDGSIWQYGLEWVRDQAAVARALVMLGDRELAPTMLRRLFTEFLDEEGAPLDSGRRREPAEVELDQNGYLLDALCAYTDWTGERGLAGELWTRVAAAADYPLRAGFRQGPAGLLRGRREFWERHALHGIEEGLELAVQCWVSRGLECAASLASRLGRTGEAVRWAGEARRLWRAALAPGGMVEGGRLCKRRGLDGTVQDRIEPRPAAGLPAAVPLAGPGPHWLEPDTATLLPLALGMVDPGGPLARRALTEAEELWNQAWEGGGCGRYHVSSEPDSPGAWPFPSLFLARADLEAGEGKRARKVLEWLHRCGGAAGTWFENYGPRCAPPFPQVGIPPWTWAELVIFFLHHLAGVRPGPAGLRVRPRLLPGCDRVEAEPRVRGRRLRLAARRAESGEEPRIEVGAKILPYTAEGVEIPWEEEVSRVLTVLPGGEA